MRLSSIAASLVACLSLACGKPEPVVAPLAESTPEPAAPPDRSPEPSARPKTLTPIAAPELEKYLSAERLTGTIALYDSSTGKLSCSDLQRCGTGYLPASTFKIANTLIALENGAVTSADSTLPWDGQEHSVADWNQDHTLRSALRTSCVPCYQQLARLVGEGSMRTWLGRLEYGNQDMSGDIDDFWLEGGLRVTPVEQIDFLWRLETGALPIHESSRETVRDILLLEESPDFALRGKTGLTSATADTPELGWFVGFVEKGRRRVYFATLIDGHPQDVELAPARRRVTEGALRDLGLLP